MPQRLSSQLAVFVIASVCCLRAAFGQEIQLVADAFRFHEAPDLSVTGLSPNDEYILAIEVVDSSKTRWFGQSVFHADETGAFSPANTAPLRGMYEGVSASAPFWSLTGGDRFRTDGDAAGMITVSDLAGAVLAQRGFKWTSSRTPGQFRVESVRLPALNASLYLPAEEARAYAPILLLGGSGGGTNTERAALLVDHGFAVLDVGYFGADGAPDFFVEPMPLERFMTAIDWIEADRRLMADRLVVMGRSYGAQLALALGVYDQRIAGIVAEAPSNTISGTPQTYPYGETQSAWSIKGVALTFQSSDGAPNPEALIPIEEFKGDLLLISGESDEIWQATAMANALADRRRKAGLGDKTTHLSHPDAGHNFGGGEQSYGLPHLPPKDRGGRSGGTIAGNSMAAIEAWEATLAFLENISTD